jgi:hypothetical protein
MRVESVKVFPRYCHILFTSLYADLLCCDWVYWFQRMLCSVAEHERLGLCSDFIRTRGLAQCPASLNFLRPLQRSLERFPWYRDLCGAPTTILVWPSIRCGGRKQSSPSKFQDQVNAAMARPRRQRPRVRIE